MSGNNQLVIPKTHDAKGEKLNCEERFVGERAMRTAEGAASLLGMTKDILMERKRRQKEEVLVVASPEGKRRTRMMLPPPEKKVRKKKEEKEKKEEKRRKMMNPGWIGNRRMEGSGLNSATTKRSRCRISTIF